MLPKTNIPSSATCQCGLLHCRFCKGAKPAKPKNPWELFTEPKDPKKSTKLDEPAKLDETSYRKGVTDTLGILSALVVPLLVPVLVAAFKRPAPSSPLPQAPPPVKKRKKAPKKVGA